MIAAAVARATSGCLIEQQQGSLAQVVQHQGGQHQAEPRNPDWLLAEVAHVGVHRLAAGYHQEDRSQHGKTRKPVLSKKVEGMPRIEGGKYSRRPHDP
jgi:hypothetical protein